MHPRLALAREADSVPGIHAGGNLDRERLALLYPGASTARPAGIRDDFPCAPTTGAGLLEREEPLSDPDLTRATAIRARGRTRSRLGSGAVAITARGKYRHPDFNGVSANRLLEIEFQAVTQISAALHAAQALNSGVGIQIEVETLDQLDEALQAGAQSLLLDNFTLDCPREELHYAPNALLRGLSNLPIRFTRRAA